MAHGNRLYCTLFPVSVSTGTYIFPRCCCQDSSKSHLTLLFLTQTLLFVYLCCLCCPGRLACLLVRVLIQARSHPRPRAALLRVGRGSVTLFRRSRTPFPAAAFREVLFLSPRGCPAAPCERVQRVDITSARWCYADCPTDLGSVMKRFEWRGGKSGRRYGSPVNRIP